MQINLPEDVSYIITQLQKAGFEAYAVGGCIRDSLLGRIPKDWDITTSALPSDVKALFKRTVDTGIAHGTVTVMLQKTGYEVTTYRIDGVYEDSRHPSSIEFTRSLVEDLRRRDFTINALAYNDTSGLVDAFSGLSDLKNKVLRCVGLATERFSEDALRILRAVRFSAELDFEIEADTLTAVRERASTLVNISAERIHAELSKLLHSPHPDRLMTAYETGITAVILPELDIYMEHAPEDGRALYQSLLEAPDVPAPVRYAVLFYYLGKSAEAIMKRLKFDNQTTNTIKKLLKLADTRLSDLTAASLRHIACEVTPELMPMLFTCREALFPDEGLEESKALFSRILIENDCLSLSSLAVSGSDLIALGLQPGPAVGSMLSKLLQLVLDDPSMNSRSVLLDFVKGHL